MLQVVYFVVMTTSDTLQFSTFVFINTTIGNCQGSGIQLDSVLNHIRERRKKISLTL